MGNNNLGSIGGGDETRRFDGPARTPVCGCAAATPARPSGAAGWRGGFRRWAPPSRNLLNGPMGQWANGPMGQWNNGSGHSRLIALLLIVIL